jgi:effector-binding domain-containing protein
MQGQQAMWMVASVASSLLLSSCSPNVEQARYTVLREQDPFEIRRYAPQIVAETTVDAEFDKAGNVAFDRLYGYISGKNRKDTSIAMTAPVEQKAAAGEIAMTAPVTQTASDQAYTVRFVMPDEYTLETLPEPADPDVRLRRIPERKMAAIRYSGTWSRKRYEQKKAELKDFIDEQDLEITGDAIFARYDPPFQLWFLRRNEVLIPVE